MADNSNNHRQRRRGGPFGAVGTAVKYAALAYGTYQFATWAWKKWNDDDEITIEEALSDAASRELESHGVRFRLPGDAPSPRNLNQGQWRVRRQRLGRCRDETAKALEGFMCSVQRAIEQRTDTSFETKELKKLRSERGSVDEDIRRQQERELWDVIKVRSVTRMIATAYAHTILYLVLTVQVNLLGGKLFEDQLIDKEAASDQMESYQNSHRFVLTNTYEYFFEQGLSSLITAVERAVNDVLQGWDVLDPASLHMSRKEFDAGIQGVREVIEKGQHLSISRPANSHCKARCLLKYLMPPTDSREVLIDDELARAILDETWDLLESPVFQDAQTDCLNATYNRLRDKEWGTVFQSDEGLVNRPLATILTKLKVASNSFYPDDMDETIKPMYTKMMETLPTVLELADVCFN